MVTTPSRTRSGSATRVFRLLNPASLAALILGAALLPACTGSDIIEPGVADEVTVTAAVTTLESIGESVQLTHTAVDANGNDVTTAPTWASSNTAVATVTAAGLVTAVSNGTASITATVDAAVGSVTITVAQVPVTASVTPGTASLNAFGATAQLTATARDDNGHTVAGVAFTWSSGAAAIATVSSTGLVTAVANGTATITATSGSMTATAAITVAQVVTQVTVSPAAATLNAVGSTQALAATPADANGNAVAAATVTWASNATAVATVSASGVVTAVSNGTANITATSNSVVGTSVITVAQTAATLAINPAGPIPLLPTATQQLTVAAQDANGVPIAAPTVTWTSNNTGVATVSAAGLVTAVGHGTATITATSGTVTATVTVNVAGVSAVVITAATSTTLTAIGNSVQLTAEARDAGGTPIPGQTFTWSSSAPNVASVNATGLVTAGANAPSNPVTITATTSGISGTIQVTVNQQATAVTVSGGGTVLTALGLTLQLTVTAPDANGNPVTPVVCTSSAPAVLSVDAACIVTAVSNGTATITATAGGKSGQATLTVSQVPTVLNISPQVLPLASLGAQGTLTAQMLDSRGNVVQGVNVTWSSLNPGIATVAEVVPETTPSTATVTAVANGNAVIEATTSIPAPAGLAATAQVVIGQVVVASQSTATVPNGRAGAQTQITVQGRDANGNPIGIGGAVVQMNISGANPQGPITATDLSNGTYTLAYTPTGSGGDVIAITMDADGAGPGSAAAISGSPFNSTVAPAIAAAANTVAPNPFPGGTSGAQTGFIVTLYDAFGNPVGTDAASAAAVVTGAVTGGPNAGAAVSAAATVPANGTWTLSYTPLITGVDVVTVMLDPDGAGPSPAAHIGTAAGLPAGSASPFNSLVVPAIASASHSVGAVPAGVAGAPTVMVVTMRDANDNLVGTDPKSANAVAAGSVTGGPNQGAAVSVVNNGNGTFNLSYTPIVAGTDVIAITLDPDGPGGVAAGAVSGSPFNSLVTASGPSAAFSSASFAPALPATAGVPVTITIQARDAQNNPITVGGAAVLATIQAGPNQGTTPLDPDGPGGLPPGFFNVAATDEGDGTYTLVYTPTLTGTDQIAILLNGSAIGTAPGAPGGPSPFAALVNPAIANAGASGAVVPAGVSGAVTTGVVTLRDQFGNLVGTNPASANAVVTASVTGGPNNGTVLTAVNNGNGTWNVSYTPVVTGTDVITVNLDPDGGGALPVAQIGTSPHNSLVAPGLVAPSKTTAVVPGGTAGLVTSITLTMRDANNNLVGNNAASANATVTSSVTGGPNNGAVLAAVNNGNGTWTLTYTPTVSGGTDVIAITLDPDGAGGVAGGPILNSPFNSLIVPGTAQAATTTAVVPGGQAGSVTTVVVTPRDGSGNAVGNDPGSAQALVAGSITGGPNPGALAASKNPNGTWNLTYTPTFTGTDPIAITLDIDGAGGAGPVAIGGSPFNSLVAPGPVVAAQSTATLNTMTVPDITAPGAQTQAGDVVSITVQGRDAFGNNVNTGTAAVVVTVGGAQPPQIPVVTNAGNGIYTASYVPTVAGVHVITITLDPDAGGPGTPTNIGTAPGVPGGPSPFSATIIPGRPSAVQTTVSVPPGKGGVVTNVAVTLRDAYNNLVIGAAPTLAGSVIGGPNSGAVLSSAVDNGGGSYTMTYTPLSLGTDAIRVTVDPDSAGPTVASAVAGSPFNSVVTVGPARAANTIASSVPGGVAGVQTDITVEMYDGGNNFVGNDAGSAGAVVTGSVTSGPNTGFVVTSTPIGDGTWTVSYTPTTIGTDFIEILLDGDPIGTAPGRPNGPSPFATTVTPAVAAAAQTTAAVPAGDAGLQTSILVTMRDQFGNEVGNDALSLPVVIAGDVTGGPNFGTLAANPNGNGTWTLTYTPTVAFFTWFSADPIEITLDPDGPGGVAPSLIQGNPFTSTVAPDSADATRTGVNLGSVPPGTAGAVTTVVVTLYDQFDNWVVNDAKSAAAILAGAITGVNAGATVTAVPSFPGQWQLTYTPIVAGQDFMTITLDLDGGGSTYGPVAISPTPYPTLVSPGAAAAANSSGQDIPSITAGQLATITVTLRDAQGNQVTTSGGSVVTASVNGGSPNFGTPVTATPIGAGVTWAVTYTPTAAGNDLINILLDGTPIGTALGVPGGPSPYSVSVIPDVVDATHSIVISEAPPGPQAPGVTVTVTVQLRDQFDNPVTSEPGGANLVVTWNSGPSSLIPQLFYNFTNPTPGTWTFQYDTAGAAGSGDDVINISYDDGGGAVPIQSSPYTVVRT